MPPAADPTTSSLSRPRRALVGAAVAVVLIALAIPLFRAAGGGGGGVGGGSAVGQLAPVFQSTDLTGQPVDLTSYRGRRVVLNFWASWCVPCRSEFPVLKSLLSRHGDTVVLGVVFQDVEGAAADFARTEGATWPSVRDPSSQIADAYGVHAKPGIPVSILIDPQGRIRARQYGPLTDQAAADTFIQRSPPG